MCLPSGWHWTDWKDGSGSLQAPDGRTLFQYDLAPYYGLGMIEYRPTDITSSWSIFYGDLDAYKAWAEEKVCRMLQIPLPYPMPTQIGLQM